MEISPVANEYIGNLNNIKAICVFGDKTKKEHDINQQVLLDVEKYALLKIINKVNIGIVITRFIKCCTVKNTYTKSEIVECSKWIQKESKGLPIVGFGATLNKYKCDYNFKALSLILSSKKLISELEKCFYDIAK